jgi:hypothetical protein
MEIVVTANELFLITMAVVVGFCIGGFLNRVIIEIWR